MHQLRPSFIFSFLLAGTADELAYPFAVVYFILFPSLLTLGFDHNRHVLVITSSSIYSSSRWEPPSTTAHS